jgi:hypothetical protein
VLPAERAVFLSRKDEAMTPFPPNWLASQPSPQALQTATDALRRRYVLPETMHHPAVAVQVLELASLLSAYGLIPTEPGSDSISNGSGFSRLRTKGLSLDNRIGRKESRLGQRRNERICKWE